MILGLRGVVYSPETYAKGLSFFRDDMELPLAREYKAGSRERTVHGSPSWAEVAGFKGSPGLIIAAPGVFGPEPLPGPAYLFESDSPAADAGTLVDRGYQQITETFHDAWWRETAIVRGPDGITVILCEFTGRPGHLLDQEHAANAAAS